MTEIIQPIPVRLKNISIDGHVAGTKSIRFTNAITVANATLNINSNGAKALYYKGTALGANIIDAGSIVVMQYNGSQYHIVSIEAPIITTSEIDTLLAN